MDTYTTFFDSFFEEITKVGLDITGLVLDHVAYQANSVTDYDAHKQEFLQLGSEVSEKLIGGRRVAIYKLNTPITYKKYSIPVLELIEPKTGQVCESGLQHAEFIAIQPYEKYMSQYPQINWDTSSMSRPDFPHLKINFENGLTLKFLKLPILEQIKLEEGN